MSTFLQLAQSLRQECGVAGTGPSTVVGQVGELKRLVDWVSEAWTEIQNRHRNWRWLRYGFTFQTVADDDTYAYGDVSDAVTAVAITRFSHWLLTDRYDPPKIFLTSAGVGTQTWMIWVPWEHFKTIYRIGTQNSGYPIHITVDPQNNIVMGPKPNGIYTVVGDYQRSAQTLALDADTPEMPTDYHKLIVYRAMEDYGYFEAAPEVLARGVKKGSLLMRQLELDQLPAMREPEPLA